MGVAPVTGCSTGIGFATAVHLSRAGFDVVATMRRPDRDGAPLLDAAHAEGIHVRVTALDVTDDTSVERAVADAGDVEVLPNNAAVMCSGSIEETPMADWHNVFDTNLYGPVRCMRAVLPGLRARGGGCIVNVSSAAGSVAVPAVGAYAASKAALEAASEVAAIEGSRLGVRVVVIETGATATAMGSKVQPPPKTSPYWDAMRNTLVWLAAQGPNLSSPDVVAEAIVRAAVDPTTPFRVAAGQGSAEPIHARDQASDEEWIATAGGPLNGFEAGCERWTGLRLGA